MVYVHWGFCPWKPTLPRPLCGRPPPAPWHRTEPSDTDIGRGGGLCSTEQAPRSLNLCCHSLPSDGVDRPFRARTLAPLLRPIVSVSSRSGKGARADMCRGRGWNGAVCTDLRTFTMCRIGYPRGGPLETPPGDLGAGVRCSSLNCVSQKRGQQGVPKVRSRPKQLVAGHRNA